MPLDDVCLEKLAKFRAKIVNNVDPVKILPYLEEILTEADVMSLTHKVDLWHLDGKRIWLFSLAKRSVRSSDCAGRAFQSSSDVKGKWIYYASNPPLDTCDFTEAHSGVGVASGWGGQSTGYWWVEKEVPVGFLYAIVFMFRIRWLFDRWFHKHGLYFRGKSSLWIWPSLKLLWYKILADKSTIIFTTKTTIKFKLWTDL